MALETVTFTPIGVVRSDHRDAALTPVQPTFAADSRGWIDVFEPYADGLDDIEGFSHIYLIYWLHRAGPAALRVVSSLDDKPHGIFATRSPNRPNPIGLSILRLLERRGSTLAVEGVDALDGTPVLDIKPYFARCDARPGARSGWADAVDGEIQRLQRTRDSSACPEPKATSRRPPSDGQTL